MPFVVAEFDPGEISFFHHDRAFRRYDPPQTHTTSVHPGLVRVEALFRPVPRVFASGEPIPSITASPMLEVSKRLITNVFRESEDVDKPARWAGKQLLLDTARTPSTRADLTVVG